MIKQNHSSFTAVVTMLVVLLSCGIASKAEAKEKLHNRGHGTHHSKHNGWKHEKKQRNIQVTDKKDKLSKSTKRHTSSTGSKSGKGYTTTGVASWYGPGFHKRKTASGERFNMYAMTAAHRTLPLHSIVRVTNLKNHKSVIVEINDRGPYVGNRKIDLSLASARAIGITGTAKVEMVVL